MRKEDFVTDMAADAVERCPQSEFAEVKKLSCGIVKRVVRVSDDAAARKTGRAKGVYLTFDCTPAALSSERGLRTLSGLLAEALVDMAGVQGRRATVLVAGLGNPAVTADSLGGAVTELLDVSPVSDAERERTKTRLCAVNTGVEGRTGIRSADTVEGVCRLLRPACVIAVDSLATSAPGRIGTSFQLTNAGIAPGSGVGRDKARLDRSSLGVPVIAVGVPLVLSLGTVLLDFARDYAAAIGCGGNEFSLRTLMSERRLGGLVVAPKEIGFHVETAACVIAGAINSVYGEHGAKRGLNLLKHIDQTSVLKNCGT